MVVRVRVNGEERNLDSGTTVDDLVRELGLSRRRIAVEVNRDILPRDGYAEACLHEGDLVEIVHFIGGG